MGGYPRTIKRPDTPIPHMRYVNPVIKPALHPIRATQATLELYKHARFRDCTVVH